MSISVNKGSAAKNCRLARSAMLADTIICCVALGALLN
jgi:hypothetical protein